MSIAKKSLTVAAPTSSPSIKAPKAAAPTAGKAVTALRVNAMRSISAMKCLN